MTGRQPRAAGDEPDDPSPLQDEKRPAFLWAMWVVPRSIRFVPDDRGGAFFVTILNFIQ